MSLLKGYKQNFDTLQRAFENGDAALVEVQRVSDGAIVAAVCAIGRDGESYDIVPFAVMVEGNPYELYRPPNPEGGFCLTEAEEARQ